MNGVSNDDLVTSAAAAVEYVDSSSQAVAKRLVSLENDTIHDGDEIQIGGGTTVVSGSATVEDEDTNVVVDDNEQEEDEEEECDDDDDDDDKFKFEFKFEFSKIILSSWFIGLLTRLSLTSSSSLSSLLLLLYP